MRPIDKTRFEWLSGVSLLRLESAIERWVRLYWKPVLLALYAAKMMYWFRSINFSSGLPITNVDYIEYYGRVLRMHEFLSRSGRLWGYDPFDMAGYLSGPFLEVGTHAIGIIAHVLEPLLPISLTMLVIEIVGLAASPFLVFPALKLLGEDRETAWIAFGIMTLTFGVCEPFSSSIIEMGLWGFMVSGFLSLFQVALLYRWIESGRTSLWLAFTAVTALVFQVHPASFVIVAVPDVALALLHWRRLGWRGWALLTLGAGVAGAANWDWMSPFLAFSEWLVRLPYFTTHGLVEMLSQFGPVQPDVFGSLAAVVNTSAIVLGIVAIREMSKTRPSLAIAFAFWAGWLFVVSFFGSYLPKIWTIQPGRNEFAFFLVMYLLSATVLRTRVLAARRSRIIAGLLMVMFSLYVLDLGPASRRWGRQTPLQTELPSWQKEFISYLQSSAPKNGRVLLECADDVKPHFADILPMTTGAVFVGGQHPGNFLTTRFSLLTGVYQSDDAYTPPMAFSHNLLELSPAEFSAYLSLYNVHLVAARTAPMIDALDRMSEVIEPIEDLPPHRIYRVKSPSTWFETGSGRVSFDYDKITIDDASAGPIVVKFHWIKTFRAHPAVNIRPVFLMDDPVPFIAIDNRAGARHIEIVNDGLPPLGERIRAFFGDKRT